MGISGIFAQVLDEIRGAWRFRWIAIAVAWAVCMVGWLFVLRMPDIYEAGARVFVNTRTALRPVLEGLTIEQDIEAQLNLVRQSLVGRPQLERVAEQTGMFTHANSAEERSRIVDGLQNRLSMGSYRGGDRGGGAVYHMTYQDTDRERSLAVLQLLTRDLRDGTLGGKREGSETARNFLKTQIGETERRLSEAEQRLADFKKSNVGLMPGTQGDYFSRLQSEIEALSNTQASLPVALKKREELARQLRGETGPGGVGVGGGAAEALLANGETAQQIGQAETRLNELLLRFTEKHPDVIAARDTLATLRQRQRDELAALRRGDAGAVAASGATSNPVFQSVQLALNQVDVEIASLRGDIAQRQRRIGELRELVNTAPEVEAELARLNRDYDVTRGQYTALVDRLQRAELGEEAEATEAIRFEIIDPPSAAFEPVAPQRPVMLAAVLMLGLGAGGGLAWLLHQLKPVFQNVRGLSDITGLPVLGAVSFIGLARHRSDLRRSYLTYAAAGSLLIIVFGALVGFQHIGVRIVQRLLG